MPLAWHQGTDRHDLACRPRGPMGAWGIVDAWHDNADSRTLHPEGGGQPVRCRLARAPQPIQMSDEAPLDAAQVVLFALTQAGFERGRMMNEAHGTTGGQRVVE